MFSRSPPHIHSNIIFIYPIYFEVCAFTEPVKVMVHITKNQWQRVYYFRRQTQLLLNVEFRYTCRKQPLEYHARLLNRKDMIFRTRFFVAFGWIFF